MSIELNISASEQESSFKKAKSLWARLGDICVDGDDKIEESFLHFPIGTDIYDIWHWFESEFDISVAKI